MRVLSWWRFGVICAILSGFWFGFDVFAQSDGEVAPFKIGSIRIVEVQTISASSDVLDYIVLQNFSQKPIDLSGWSMRICNNKAVDGVCNSRKTSASLFSADLKKLVLNPGQTWKWSKKSKLSGKGGSIALFDNSDDGADSDKPNKNGKIITSIIWGNPKRVFLNAPKVANPSKCEIIVWDEIAQNYKLERQSRVECEIVPYNGEKLIINEVLPNPVGKDEKAEFIELYNPNNFSVSLRGWELLDGAKNSKPYKFAQNEEIGAKGYLVVYRAQFGFALNNSGGERVVLRAPDAAVVDEIQYTQSVSEGVSLGRENFGSVWRTSKVATPAKGNQFPPLLEIDVVRIDGKIYRNIPADFKVRTKGGEGKVKVTWDFGDGRRSYKAQTTHKYKQTGKYTVSVRVSDGVQEVRRQMEVEVRKFEAVKVRIVEIMPNPDGADTGVEYVRLVNKGKKRVNLRGWSIATGSSTKKLVNHPIREKLVIDVRKMRKITTKRAAISLNNTKGVVELRRPDGSLAHRKKYKFEGGVPENAIYLKKDRQWQWDLSAVPVKKSKSKKSKKSTKKGNSSAEVQKIIAQAWENEFAQIANPLVLGAQTTNTQETSIAQIKPTKFAQFTNKVNYLISRTIATGGRNLWETTYSKWLSIWYLPPENTDKKSNKNQFAQNQSQSNIAQITITQITLSLSNLSNCTINDLIEGKCSTLPK